MVSWAVGVGKIGTHAAHIGLTFIAWLHRRRP